MSRGDSPCCNMRMLAAGASEGQGWRWDFARGGMAWGPISKRVCNPAATAAPQAAASERRRRPDYAVHCLDLDRFKAVNDTLGHAAGDALLRAVAMRLREAVHDADLVARLDGDEFAIIQYGAENPDDAVQLAGRILATFAAPFEVDGQRIVSSTSIGIALASFTGNDPDELMRRADLALHLAKADGRGTHRCFEPGIDAQTQARRSLEIALGDALARGEFELHYQAEVSLMTRATLGFEALLRWHSPDHGLVPPARFIPLAEDSSVIVTIGEWVLRQACADAATWPEQVSLAVNLSAMQFGSAGLVQVVTSALAQSGLAPARLELELTESALVQHSNRTLETLHDLCALGVRIAMDDFGTGYSSLDCLRRFPLSKIKIDRSFVKGLGTEDGCEAIIRAVVGLGASFDIDTVAKGIETETQAQQVRALGCIEGQGLLFGPPLPLAHLQPLLSRAVGHPAGKALDRRGVG